MAGERSKRLHALASRERKLHTCARMQRLAATSSCAVAVSRGTGALALQRGGVTVSCATCRPAYLTRGKANGGRLAAMTQRSSRQRRGGKAWRGRVTMSTLPWSTSAAKASRLHSRSSLENGTREHGRVSKADDCGKRFCSLQVVHLVVLAHCPSSMQKNNLHWLLSATGIRSICSHHHHACRPPVAARASSCLSSGIGSGALEYAQAIAAWDDWRQLDASQRKT